MTPSKKSLAAFSNFDVHTCFLSCLLCSPCPKHYSHIRIIGSLEILCTTSHLKCACRKLKGMITFCVAPKCPHCKKTPGYGNFSLILLSAKWIFLISFFQQHRGQNHCFCNFNPRDSIPLFHY